MTFSPEQISGAIAFAASVPPNTSLNSFFRLLLESEISPDMLHMSPAEQKSSNVIDLFSEKVAAAVFSNNVSLQSAATTEYKENLTSTPALQEELKKEIQSFLSKDAS
jgi:hypothetical protein